MKEKTTSGTYVILSVSAASVGILGAVKGSNEHSLTPSPTSPVTAVRCARSTKLGARLDILSGRSSSAIRCRGAQPACPWSPKVVLLKKDPMIGRWTGERKRWPPGRASCSPQCYLMKVEKCQYRIGSHKKRIGQIGNPKSHFVREKENAHSSTLRESLARVHLM